MRVDALANPNILIWARRMSGLDLGETAHKAGVKEERLQAWESGEVRPTIAQLRKLSDIYKRPLALFFFDRPPPDEGTPSDFRRLDPQATEPLSPELRLVVRNTIARREAALELLDDLDEEPPVLELSAHSSEDPEEVGTRLRHSIVGDAIPPAGDTRLIFNFWRAAAEDSGILVFQAEDVGVEEMRGFSVSERPLPAVVLNIKDSPGARTFSLFHEISHVAINRGGLCLFAEEGPSTSYAQMEVFCNHVAGAALLPRRSLLREPAVPSRRVNDLPDEVIVDLARRYGSNREVLLRRLLILDRITTVFYRRKREEYKRQHDERAKQPRASGFAPPYTMAVATHGRLFTRVVLEAYDTQRITTSDVANYLQLRVKHLDKVRAAVRQSPTAGDVV